MADITLYMAPGTCARVTAIALAELGLDFNIEVIRFKIGEHKSPKFLALNPIGKVPVLFFDGHALTENVAILNFLNNRYGGLLPKAADEFEHAAQLADLCFCSATLHPNVTRIRMPQMFSEEAHAPSIKQRAFDAMDTHFQVIENRLSTRSWWYGDEWSAIDAYLYWVFWRVEGADYNVSRFPSFVAHARRMEARDAVKKALALEEKAQVLLEKEGLAWAHPPVGEPN